MNCDICHSPVTPSDSLEWNTLASRDVICWRCVKRLCDEWLVSPHEDAICGRCGKPGETRLIASVGWKACSRCMSVAADCLSDQESPPTTGEPGRISLGARRRTRLVWLKCYSADHIDERLVVIAEHDAEMRLGRQPLPSRAFAVYENGRRVGVEISPADAGLTIEGVAARLAGILKCDRVEQVAALETERL